MNCVLIGYRGTGKTTIGKLVAAELDLPYVSLDAEIVRRAGLTIPELVARHSWERFREIEESVVEEFTARDRQVLDTGGGAVTRPANIERLRRTGIVFLLVASIDDIVRRIGSDDGRPSLTGAKSFTDEVAEVLAARAPLYRKAAHHTLDTSALDPEAAARAICELYRAAAGAL